MEQDTLRRDDVRIFMRGKGIHAQDIDIVMARGGLFYPVVTGIYSVNEDMREVLRSCKYGRHACNLSAIIADDLAKEITEKNVARGVEMPFGVCRAYIADPPMADEMLPECRVGGLPEFQRRPFFHALNSRAVVRRYLKDHGYIQNDITAIVAHIGGGITVTLHRNGKVIDSNNGVGGDGPFTPERVGSCPGFQLVDLCYSGEYSKAEIKKKLMGKGGAVAFFGTNDLKEIVRRGEDGDVRAKVWMEAFVLNIAKYIASEAADVCGKVDVILLTGGGAYGRDIVSGIRKRVEFIAPVEVVPSVVFRQWVRLAVQSEGRPADSVAHPAHCRADIAVVSLILRQGVIAQHHIHTAEYQPPQRCAVGKHLRCQKLIFQCPAFHGLAKRCYAESLTHLPHLCCLLSTGAFQLFALSIVCI